MPQPFKVEELLSREELDQLEAFAREPGRSVDECFEWMQAHGFTLARSSVGRWKQHFDEQLLAERMRAGGGFAKAVIEAAKDSGGLGIPDAAIMTISQKIFEAVSAPEVDLKSLGEMSLMMQRLTLSKARVENVRTELSERFATEAQKLVGKRELTQDDINEVRKATFG